MVAKTILVVEDNPIAAMTAKVLLETFGCRVETTANGDSAIELAKTNRYDGICMDIGLPTISGKQACIAIREYESQHHLTPVPIIAVTGNNSPEEVKEYIEAGMQHVIDKPLTKEKVESFLSFCL